MQLFSIIGKLPLIHNTEHALFHNNDILMNCFELFVLACSSSRSIKDTHRTRRTDMSGTQCSKELDRRENYYSFCLFIVFQILFMFGKIFKELNLHIHVVVPVQYVVREESLKWVNN